MESLVIDASVLLKWALPAQKETWLDQAGALARFTWEQEVRVMLPSMWFYEIGNILTLKLGGEAKLWLHKFASMGFETLEPTNALSDTAVELTQHYNVTFYDASYHALAIVKNSVLVTADQKYINRAEAAGHIMHLKDWPME